MGVAPSIAATATAHPEWTDQDSSAGDPDASSPDVPGSSTEQPVRPFIALGAADPHDPTSSLRSAGYFAITQDVETLRKHLTDDHRAFDSVQVYDVRGRLLRFENAQAQVIAHLPARKSQVAQAVRRILGDAARQLLNLGCTRREVSALYLRTSGLSQTVTSAAELMAEFPGYYDPRPTKQSAATDMLRRCLYRFEPTKPVDPTLPVPHPAGWLHNLWHRITGS